jgi:hypothetical protein
MKKTYKEVMLSERLNEEILGSYIQGICDLHAVGRELTGTILFSIAETAEVLIRLKEEFLFDRIGITGEFENGSLTFTVRGIFLTDNQLNTKDEIDLGLIALKYERELFIVSKLADKVEFLNNSGSVKLSFSCGAMDYAGVNRRILQLQDYWNEQVILKRVD